MSRPLRIDYPGAWHHVMNRSRKGIILYHDDEDFLLFLSLIQETSAMYHMNVSAYCLMSNHYHLLVQTEEGNLARCMRHINGIYTQKYNIRHKCDGTLFRGRYKSVLVQADSYLLELVRYIHRNPVKAGIADTPDTYKWSSHTGYISKTDQWQWLYKDLILSMLSTKKKEQVNKYLSFMGLNIPEKIALFYSKKNQPSILGEDNFINWVKETFFKEKSNREIPESKLLAPDIGIINKTVSAEYSVDSEKLFSAKRGTENEPRNVAIYLIRQLRGEPLKKIGERFNLRKDSSVSSVLERVQKKVDKDKKFSKRVEKIKEKLYKGQTET